MKAYICRQHSYMRQHYNLSTAVINKLNKARKKKSFNLNAKKTKYMYIDKGMPNLLDIFDEHIECADHLRYLGSTRTDSAYRSKDINARMKMVRKRMQISITSGQAPI